LVRHRLRSPLRWLSAVMSALMLLVLIGAFGETWMLIVIPIVAGLFLLAPPLGIYRHDETPAPRTGIRLEAFPVDDPRDAMANVVRFRLVLVNSGDVAAEDFRIRLLVPHAIAPPNSRVRPLGTLHVGEMGRNWFIDSAYDATAITLRTAPADSDEEITCLPGSRQELADLLLPAQRSPFDVSLEYQVSGGSVKAAIERVRLRSDARR
jgi:hypothetical protein